MDLSRAVYNRDLKIAAMRALDAGSATGEIARKYQLSPKLLERWRGEWRAKGESAFPALGGGAPICRRSRMPDGSRNWSARSASSPWRMIFKKRPCIISRIITRRPSSVARMPV